MWLLIPSVDLANELRMGEGDLRWEDPILNHAYWYNVSATTAIDNNRTYLFLDCTPGMKYVFSLLHVFTVCLLYTSPSPRD